MVQSVVDPIVLSPSLPSAQRACCPPVVRLLLLKHSAPIMVPLLDGGNVGVDRSHDSSVVSLEAYSVETALVRVERDYRFWGVRLGSLLPEGDYDPVREDGQRAQREGRVIEVLAMVLTDDQLQLHVAAGPDRKVDDARVPVELVRLVLGLHHKALDVWDSWFGVEPSPPS